MGVLDTGGVKMNKTLISLGDCSIYCKGQKCIRGLEKNVLSYYIKMGTIQEGEGESASVGLAASGKASQRGDLSPLFDHKLL